MCAIAGAFHHDGEPVTAELLSAMRDSMRHRGPDGAGLWLSGERDVGLAHRLLAITADPAAAAQPVSSEDGKIQIVFNGEIYNHEALRRELAEAGAAFRSERSDTEVLLRAYERWGARCVERLRGMFAFAAWDGRRRELVLARDRLGIKPLHYAVRPGGIVFASEARALFAAPFLRREVCPQAVSHYLTLLAVPPPRTMFRGVLKVEAGTLVTVDAGGRLRVTRYWDPAAFLNRPSADGEQEAFERTRDLITSAVQAMARADGQIGCMLSGGIDSGLVAALTRRSGARFRAVTLDYEVPSAASESAMAARVARRLGVEIDVCTVSARQMLDAHREHLAMQGDAPAGAPDVPLVHVAARRLRDAGIRVCLVGEGADELGGYPSYLEYDREYPLLRAFSRLPPPLRRALHRLAPAPLRARLGVALGGVVASRRHVQAFTEEEKRALWAGPRVESSYAALARAMAEIDGGLPDAFLRRVQNLELKLRLPEMMLPRIDYPTMASAVEARVPFLDQALVEYSLRLPSSVKMRGGIAKLLVKRVHAELLGAPETARKIGFGRVLGPFLRDVVPRRLEDEIAADPGHPLWSYANRRAVARLVREHERSGQLGFNLWTLYALGKWLEVRA